MTVLTAYNGEERPQLNLEEEEADETFGRIVAEPLEAGFGMTVGNALRRTLLSALPGTAITAVRIEGVEHEFSTIANVKEDMIEFLLNVKDIRIRSLTDRPGKMFLEAAGEGEVTAGADPADGRLRDRQPGAAPGDARRRQRAPLGRVHGRAGPRLRARRHQRRPRDRRHPGRRDLLAGAARQLQGRAHARRPGDELRPPDPRGVDGRHDHARSTP